MNRRTFLQQAAAAAVTAVQDSKDSGGKQRKPNIIFILADDLGWGELGCYGQKDILTPHIDALAGAGTRFTQAYSGSTVCAPSRACLLTGLHTGHVSVRGNTRRPMAEGETTIADVLKTAGYRTAVIGKWGMGAPGTTGDPAKQGFDEFFGYANHVAAHNNFPPFVWRGDKKEMLPGNAEEKQGTYSNDLFTRESLAFVRRNQDKPFFLYLNYTIPHANSTGKTIDAPEIAPAYRDKPWPEVEKKYASTLSRMDENIGQIVRELQALKLTSDTLIVFTSDNGPHQEGGHKPPFFHSSGPLKGKKRDLYEGGIRVPAIAVWPGMVPAKTVSEGVWYFPDMLPTLAAVARATPPPGVDGVSVLPLLLQKSSPPSRPPLYWEFHERGFQQAVRQGDWKAIRRAVGAPLELYNLRADRGEVTDVAKAQPEVVARIETYLKTARAESPFFPIRERPAKTAK